MVVGYGGTAVHTIANGFAGPGGVKKGGDTTRSDLARAGVLIDNGGKRFAATRQCEPQILFTLANFILTLLKRKRTISDIYLTRGPKST